MGVGTAIGIGGIAAAGIGAGGSILAGSTQASAANNAAQLQYQSGQNALGFQQEVFNQEQANEAPFIGTGQAADAQLAREMGIAPTNTSQINTGASEPTGLSGEGIPSGLSNLSSLSSMAGTPSSNSNFVTENPNNPWTTTNATRSPLPSSTAVTQRPNAGTLSAQGTPGVPGTTPTSIGGINYNLQTGGGTGENALSTPWESQFQAPTAASAAQTPGYQFALQQGENAMQNSAAAQGDVFSGGTLKGLDQYANGMASTNYQQAYNNALTQYQQSYNQFQTNQGNQFNRLSALAGGGQTAVSQLNSAGANAAANASNTLANTGAQVGQQINNAGAANASGYAGATNAATGAIGNSLTLASLSGMLNQNGSNNNLGTELGAVL